MTSRELEEEFKNRNLGHLWDDSWNGDAHAEMTLTISEVRQISNLLRKSEGRKRMTPLCPLENDHETMERKSER